MDTYLRRVSGNAETTQLVFGAINRAVCTCPHCGWLTATAHLFRTGAAGASPPHCGSRQCHSMSHPSARFHFAEWWDSQLAHITGIRDGARLLLLTPTSAAAMQWSTPQTVVSRRVALATAETLLTSLPPPPRRRRPTLPHPRAATDPLPDTPPLL